MSSFYGGKQGKTYHIVEHFDSVSAMTSAFKAGDSYSKVAYGEYVIIDTPSKSNPQNGLLFRRDFYYNDPPRDLPLKSDSEYKDSSTGAFLKDKFYKDFREALISTGVGAGALYVGQIVGPQGQMTDLEITTWDTLANAISSTEGYGNTGSVVLTSTRSGKIFDDIKSGYANIVNTQGDVTGCYISFDFPNMILEFQGKEIEDYWTETGYNSTSIDGTPTTVTFSADTTAVLTTANLIQLDPKTGASANHPFYYKFNVGVPKGKSGTSISSVYISTNNSGDEVLKYDYVSYASSIAGDTTIGNQIGEWRVIEKIDPITGRKYTTLATQTALTYNVGDVYTDGMNNFVCITSGEVPTTATMITSTVIGAEFEYGNSKWRTVSLPDNNITQLDVDYTAGKNDKIGIRNLDYITFADNGDFYATYVEGTSSDVINTSSVLLGHTKQIKDIKITNAAASSYNYSETENLQINYKDNTQYTSPAINRVLDIKSFGDHIGVLYSNPDVRANISTTYKIKSNWTDAVSGSTYPDMEYLDLGKLNGEYHVGSQYTKAQLSTGTSLGLNGFPSSSLQYGWMITVMEESVSQGSTALIRALYAFDEERKNNGLEPYNIGTETNPIWSYWRKVTSFDKADVEPESSLYVSISSAEANNVLQKNGYWFVVTS